MKFWTQTDSLLSVLTEEASRCLKHCVFYCEDSGEVPGKKTENPAENRALRSMVMLRLLLLLTYTCLERVTKDVPVIFLGVKYKSMSVKVNSRSQQALFIVLFGHPLI